MGEKLTEKWSCTAKRVHDSHMYKLQFANTCQYLEFIIGTRGKSVDNNG